MHNIFPARSIKKKIKSQAIQISKAIKEGYYDVQNKQNESDGVIARVDNQMNNLTACQPVHMKWGFKINNSANSSRT